MIKRINRIENFGVFKDYRRTGNIEDFKELNIIYGWNYSGKTTLSRLIDCFNQKKISEDYSQANFDILDGDSKQFTKENLSEYAKQIRVFNSDFQKNNLKWDGESFEPVLLLGEESIEKEKEIERLSEKTERLTIITRNLKEISSSLIKKIESELSNKASNIKANLGIVQAFTKTHLKPIFNQIKNDHIKYKLSESDVKDFLIIAKSSESDKKPIQELIVKNLTLTKGIIDSKELLLEVPAFSKTISYLVENPEISNWVEKGTEIHQGKTTCDFCQNPIEEKRKNELLAHFSEDLKNHKENLGKLLQRLEESKIKIELLDTRDFYTALNIDFENINSEIKSKIKFYNNQINLLSQKIERKINSPFEKITDFVEISDNSNEISDLIKSINDYFNKNNQYTADFDTKKSEAITKLKKHYTAELIESLELSKMELKINNYNIKAERFDIVISKQISEIKVIEAEISNAQKGRETINHYIHSFLGRDEIKVDVINDEGNEFFTLKRNDEFAKNLSEGEKTAIAFSFFLTKLLEITDLEESIIYIDDPISSLDSNHIFQVNALLKDFFFQKEENSAFKLKCNQLFVSTHNFEFFNLLRELPLPKKKTEFYFVKRKNNNESVINRLPKAIKNYKSEYHYLFGEIYNFHNSEDKDDYEKLINIPNSVRRFVELYSYSKIPGNYQSKVDERTDKLFGVEKSKRIMKVLHYFSHSNNIDRMITNSDLLCDVENAVTDLMEELEKDTFHYEELYKSLN